MPSPSKPILENVSTSDTLRLDEQGLARAAALSGPRIHPPANVPGYEIQRCLGNGAYGSVWLAVERNTGKHVAIKFYSHRRGLDWSLLNREVEKLAVLYTSREIIGLLQVGWDSDPPYYVMEFMPNGSLSRLLEQGPLPAPEAVRIAGAVTSALVHAQQNGILHCDVKPANVLLDSDFEPRLADFGQARLSHEQSPALGTLFYMAPEQADLQAVPDPRWDVYALGALLYHMLAGEPPYKSPENEKRITQAEGIEQKLAAYREIVERGARPTRHRTTRGVDARLADIVDRCLAPDPRRRYRDAAAVAEALASRARSRSLRPMIGLGIVLPGLLLLGLFPLGVKAVNNAVKTAENNIADSALESESVAAKILAYALNDELVQRQRSTEQIAEDPELQTLIHALKLPRTDPDRIKLDAWLADNKKYIDDIRKVWEVDLDDSWFLTDEEGVQRWREPYNTGTADRSYAWRDYFHGRGVEYTPDTVPADIAPIRQTHISLPFQSTSSGQFKVAITVPVWDKEHKNVLAVLGRTFEIGSLLTSYKRLITQEGEGRVERVIALADLRTGQLIDHPWMTEENVADLPADTFGRLTLWPEEHAELLRLRALVDAKQHVENENRDTKFYDPIRKVNDATEKAFGMAWLAAFWPVGKTGWVAIVQERKDEALLPVREIQAGLIKYALLGLALCLTLVATSWFFVRRVMKARTFRLGRGNGSGVGTPNTATATMPSA